MSYRVEKNGENIDIVIDGWSNGIASDPYSGIGDMRNVDNSSIPGEVSVAFKTEAMISQAPITSATVTVDHTTDVFTYNGTVPLEVNTCITFTNSGGALPAGLSANTPYYIKTVPTPTTFTISAVSAGGAQKLVTDNGTGTQTFSTINMGTPKFFTKGLYDNYYNFYFLGDSNGRIWVYNSGGLIGSTNKWVYLQNQTTEDPVFLSGMNCLIYWKGYLFWFTATTIYVKAIGDPANFKMPSLAWLTGGGWLSWKTSATSTNSTDSKYALVGQDDILYFCNKTYVGSIKENVDEEFHPVTGATAADGITTDNDATISTATNFFTSGMVGSPIEGTGIPAGAYIISYTDAKNVEISEDATITDTGVTITIPTSYTYNANALDLPSDDEAICLAELGVNLLVGGRNNKIYPWDRVSPSFSYPILLSENFVSRMVTVNTTTYIFLGQRGRIYVTNGANVSLFTKIPDFLSDTVTPYFMWTDAIFNRNKLYFGFQCKNNSGTVLDKYGGLWSIDLQDNGIKLENKMSYDTYAGYVTAIFPNLKSTNSPTVFPSSDGYGLFIGWYSGTTGGVDKGISTPYVAGEAYIDSDMIPIGLFLEKRNPTNLEFKLTTPLVTGESVALYYRDHVTDTYTSVPITQGGSVGDISGIAIPNFQDLEWIQLRAVLTSTASSPSFVRLRELRIRS